MDETKAIYNEKELMVVCKKESKIVNKKKRNINEHITLILTICAANTNLIPIFLIPKDN
jgi:hypothetical protein